jgi:hypothetical protein
MRTLIGWVRESGGLASMQLLCGWTWRVTTAKTGVHHQQIRDAVERPGLGSPEFLDPLLDTMMRALPKTYESRHAEGGATVVVELNDGSRSLSWSLVMEMGRGWTMYPGIRSLIPTARVIVPADAFWRLATGNVPRLQAVEQSRLSGDQRLANHLFEVVSVVR